ncbi:MAG: sulfatase-like hydrolase/transferase [Bacteroidia bacterium]|nr:sulfatase-like hydrolase/transferase [Bacteroidia bacterium]NNJ56771.1 sulfatase-like hydrolase/transferase [Bacteroidia bacterium]
MAIWYGILFIGLAINLFAKSKALIKLNTIVFAILFLAALVFNLINVFYYPTSKNIAGVELFTMIGGQEWGIIFSYITHYWYLILVAVLLLYGAVKLFLFITLEFKNRIKIGFVLMSLGLLFGFARGTFTLKPLNSMNAFEVLPANGAKTAITPLYVLLESYGKKPLEELNYFPEDEILASLQQNRITLPSLGSNKPNICIILLESFGKEYTGLNKGKGSSYTPFLDSLMDESLNFTNAYANGLRSMDAVASIYAGIPSLMDQSFVGSLYTGNNINSLFNQLKELGYLNTFYHAADEQSMGFKSFLTAQGLDRYVANQQYPNSDDFDGTWGIFDEPFLQFYANELGNMKQPWCSSIFTLSSHHPYAVPKKYNKLKKGTLPIHRAVRYSDIALRNFFIEARTQPWFSNTVFVLTADHSSVNKNKRYKTHRGSYEVPLLVYAPSLFEPEIITKPVQHLDLYPTVLQLAGMKDSVFALGKSLLDSNYAPIVHYEGNRYCLTDSSYALEMVGKRKFKLYNYKEDPNYRYNLSRKNSALKEAMENKLKLNIQKFNYSIINNHFY